MTLRDTLTVSPSDALRVNRHDPVNPVGYGATKTLIKWDSTIKPWIKHELVYLQMGLNLSFSVYLGLYPWAHGFDPTSSYRMNRPELGSNLVIFNS